MWGGGGPTAGGWVPGRAACGGVGVGVAQGDSSRESRLLCIRATHALVPFCSWQISFISPPCCDVARGGMPSGQTDKVTDLELSEYKTELNRPLSFIKWLNFGILL